MAEEVFPKTTEVEKPNVISNPVIKGRGNFVDPSAENVLVSGDSNSVGAYVKDSYILGSSGCIIPAGLRNVYILNSSGVIATESDTNYINGYCEKTVTVQTTTTSPVDAVVITHPNNSTTIIKAEIIGISSVFTSNYGGAHTGFYRCESSMSTVMGLNTTEYTSGDPSSTTITTSGQTVIIRVTGIAGVMNWKIKYSYQTI